MMYVTITSTSGKTVENDIKMVEYPVTVVRSID